MLCLLCLGDFLSALWVLLAVCCHCSMVLQGQHLLLLWLCGVQVVISDVFCDLVQSAAF